MDETDKAFIERVGADPEGANGADYVRLFNLARRGAAIPDRATEEMEQAGHAAMSRCGFDLFEMFRAMIQTALEVK